jgi:hypothetical protein
MYGYDFCGNAENFIFRNPKFENFYYIPKLLYNWFGVPIINYIVFHLDDVISSVERHYADLNLDFTYVPMWGTLQQVVENQEDGDFETVYTFWCHSALENMADHMHANKRGFKILMKKLYKLYFKGEIELGRIARNNL